jgi:uncharacterized RDD family membrane protein YckC
MYQSHDSSAGLLRRLGALISDSLVVVGLLILGSLLFIPLLTHLNAKAMVPSEVGWGWCVVYWGWLMLIWCGFIGYFWTRSGQTVGMKAWRIRVEGEQGCLLNWPQSIQRLSYAALPWLPGFGALVVAEHYHSRVLKLLGQGLFLLGVADWLAMFLDMKRRTWHDRISRTAVKTLPKL